MDKMEKESKKTDHEQNEWTGGISRTPRNANEQTIVGQSADESDWWHRP
jgi:hypothetical protein